MQSPKVKPVRKFNFISKKRVETRGIRDLYDAAVEKAFAQVTLFADVKL